MVAIPHTDVGPLSPSAPHRARVLIRLNWFCDRDCRHTLSPEQYSYATEGNRARRPTRRILSRGAERKAGRGNGGTLRDPSSAFKFISRISFHGLRGRSTAGHEGDRLSSSLFLLLVDPRSVSTAPVIPRFSFQKMPSCAGHVETAKMTAKLGNRGRGVFCHGFST